MLAHAPLVLATLTLMGAQPVKIPPPPDQPLHREAPRLPPGAPASAQSPGAVVPRGDFVNIQANVNANGNNVVGDAANEPSLAVDPTAPNRLAVGWRQFDTINSDFRQAGYAYSRDGGRTWAPKQIIEPGLFRSDPVLAAAHDGTFYFLSLSTPGGIFQCHVFGSDDAGATWPHKTFAFGGDKSWLVADPAPGAGNLYEAWQVAANQYFPAQFSRSNDANTTWEQPTEFGDNAFPSFGIMDVGPDGEVYVCGGENGGSPNVIWVMRSDNAQNPSAPEPTFTVSNITVGQQGQGGVVFFAGNGSPNPGGLVGQVNIGVDRSDGPTRANVYVLAEVFGVFPGSQSIDVALWRSTDGGMTWSDPVQVSDTPDNPSYRWLGTMDVAPNGRIDVVFNDTRNFFPDDGVFDMSETFYTHSEDGGQTWSKDVPIGPAWNSYLGWPQQQKIGDYYDLKSDLVGAHLIYATTYNNEQDVYYLRINDYDCNANGVPDTIDIDNGDVTDCNGNAIPDSCEIAAGTLADSDADGIPDICDCPADCNADGDLNILDFVCFQNLFTSADPDADCNGDAELNILDFVCFQNEFTTGCN